MSDFRELDWIEPSWPFADMARVLTTTRTGGVSEGAFAGLNLADHVGDDPDRVLTNRRRLSEMLGGMPVQWLEQVHGTTIIEAGAPDDSTPVADGAWTAERGQVLAVLTADCLPVVLADRQFEVLAAIHGGWRGLVGGVLAAACAAMPVRPAFAWLGPAIGPDAYEVGDEVLQAVTDQDPSLSRAIRRGTVVGKGYLDLFSLAELQLQQLGVAETYTERHSTCNTERFYSYRREGQTGRMATLAWLPTRRG